MKVKLFAPLLLSLIAAPAFAHGNHDDEETAKPATQEAGKDAPAKPKTAAPAAGKKDVPAPAPVPVEPKKS